MKFIANKPAMLVGKSLIIADLHLGIECEMGMECRARRIISDTVKEIRSLIKETKAKELIILGDVKHRIMETGSLEGSVEEQVASELEWKIEQEIPALLKEIERDGIRVRVIKGNHDGRLKMETEEEIFLEERGKRYCFLHGHKSPSLEAIRADFIVMGHIHPAVSFVDRLGKRTVRKVWIKGSFEKGFIKERPGCNPDLGIIVMPAFNEFITGSPVNETGLEGPLLKRQMFKIANAQIFLLNGVEIDFKTLIRK